jgi:type VI secretion system FHA domain protein
MVSFLWMRCHPGPTMEDKPQNPRVPLRVRVVVVPPGAAVPPSTLLTGDMIRVGRLADNDLVMPRTALSVGRQHAVFKPVEGTWRIIDQSSNGTYHNGQFLHHAVSEPLKHNDVLVLGEVEMRIELVEQQQITAAKPIFPSPDEAAQHQQGWPESDPKSWPEPDQKAWPEPENKAWPEPEPKPWPESSSAASTGQQDIGSHVVDVPQPVPEKSMTSVLRDLDQQLVGLYERQSKDTEERTSLVDEQAIPLPENLKPVDDSRVEPEQEEPVPPAVPQATLLDAFLAGAGIRELPPDLDPEAAMRALGESSRVIVQTLADILQARRELKHVFRIRQTVVDRGRNNPLKFAADEQEMLLSLLGKPRPGYVTGVDAVAEAGKDLMRHQIAVIEAFRAVIDAIFTRLAPERLEAAARGRNRLLGDGFKEHYGRVYADLREDFGEVVSGKLGQLFAEAYEQHAPSADPAARAGWGRPPNADR